jgi:hypothetical protein
MISQWWHFYLSTWEAEAGESPLVQGQPGQQREFQDKQNYIEKPCLGKKKKIPASQISHLQKLFSIDKVILPLEH